MELNNYLDIFTKHHEDYKRLITTVRDDDTQYSKFYKKTLNELVEKLKNELQDLLPDEDIQVINIPLCFKLSYMKIYMSTSVQFCYNDPDDEKIYKKTRTIRNKINNLKYVNEIIKLLKMNTRINGILHAIQDGWL